MYGAISPEKSGLKEGVMVERAEYIIKNIDFTMKMEDMPLTDEDKARLKICLSGDRDIDEVLRETIKKHAHAAV